MKKSQKPSLSEILANRDVYQAKQDYKALKRGTAEENYLEECLTQARNAYQTLLSDLVPQELLDCFLNDVIPEGPKAADLKQLAVDARALAGRLERFLKLPQFNPDISYLGPPGGEPPPDVQRWLEDWPTLGKTPESLRKWSEFLGWMASNIRTTTPRGVHDHTLLGVALAQLAHRYTGRPHFQEVEKIIAARFPDQKRAAGWLTTALGRNPIMVKSAQVVASRWPNPEK